MPVEDNADLSLELLAWEHFSILDHYFDGDIRTSVADYS